MLSLVSSTSSLKRMATWSSQMLSMNKRLKITNSGLKLHMIFHESKRLAITFNTMRSTRMENVCCVELRTSQLLFQASTHFYVA
ncbi:predicted protein [Botrytis cinerea T4]|uniref:Uncharacterized protein n=1 Tax=Botryotinia fuckeliana (strain T4) TaxID=999810 RepID=G2Y9S3_BOTF4|nr:predicted protein [Botrytis cinerea T4]